MQLKKKQPHIDAPAERKPLAELSLIELGVLLVKHAGLHEGLFDAGFNFRVAIGGIGEKAELLPGAAIAVAGVALLPTTIRGPHTVDAAVVNPPNQVPPKKKRNAKVL